MSAYLVTATFDATSGLPEDQVVNTWHFDCTADADADQACLNVADFYATAPTGFANPVVYYYSPKLNGNITIKAYQLSDPIPRLPVTALGVTYTPRTLIGGLPDEVALCMSYKHSPYVGGVSQASQRGRIYLGPLNPEAFAGYGGGDEWTTPPRPATGFLNIIAAAASDLEDNNTATCKWVVYSPTLNQMFTATDGWIDNAFDTQRRRGVAPTARTLWS